MWCDSELQPAFMCGDSTLPVCGELWRYTSQPRTRVYLESRANLESTTSQVNFFNFAPPKNIWISREHIAGYRLSQQLTTGYFDNKLRAIATRGRVASFLIFVPFDLETTITVEGWCLQNFISVAKLHLFHTEINDNITVVMAVAWPSG